jgi:hypothetical protein
MNKHIQLKLIQLEIERREKVEFQAKISKLSAQELLRYKDQKFRELNRNGC